MCGWRATDANSTSTSVRRASNASGASRPADGLEAVPERLRIRRVMQQDRVTEVAQLAIRHRVDPGLVHEQATHRPGVDGASQALGGGPVVHGPNDTAQHPGPRRTGLSPRAVAPPIRTEAPDGRSMSSGSGSPAAANHARNPSRVARAVPWYSSSSWTPAISSPWRVRNSSGRGGQGPVEDDDPAPGSERGPGGLEGRDRVGQLVEGVLEVRQHVLGRRPGLPDVRLADRDPVGQAGRRHVRPGARDRVRLELDARQGQVREPSRHRDEPPAAAAVDVDDSPPRPRSATSCGTRARTSWKNTAMSWTVSRSIDAR